MTSEPIRWPLTAIIPEDGGYRVALAGVPTQACGFDRATAVARMVTALRFWAAEWDAGRQPATSYRAGQRTRALLDELSDDDVAEWSEGFLRSI